MSAIRPKKRLGQHFLKDRQIAIRIVEALTCFRDYPDLLEIGPGMGVLSEHLFAKKTPVTHLVELDRESVAYLRKRYPEQLERIIEGDFLKLNFSDQFPGNFGIIGNFPYNISSQIFFRVLEWRNQVPEVVGMLQKEVAERICAPSGSKTYGILSVLLQAFYVPEYLFTVPPDVFHPPPKVNSAVIRLLRNDRIDLPCSEKLFFRVVKQSFQTRRKTLRNALKSLALPATLTSDSVFDLRAEALSSEQFIELTCRIESAQAS
jgi:16S rRNA (adenine1518-N6/adenine1519-N6)-dimethyltransferase